VSSVFWLVGSRLLPRAVYVGVLDWSGIDEDYDPLVVLTVPVTAVFVQGWALKLCKHSY
jgi:hypothetical protein